MRMLNEIRRTTKVTASGMQVETLERVRGVAAGGDGRRGFRYERHEPQAVVVHGPQGSRRVDLPAPRSNMLAGALPVALYLVTRSIVRRRRR